jgi:hypothetical protein
MKIKFERIHYKQLRIDEYILVVIYTIDICRKYNIAAMHLKKSYSELAGFRNDLESLKVHVRKNEKMTRLGKLDGERDSLIRCINNVVDSFDEVDIPEIVGDYEILSILLNKHKTKTVASDTRTSETERLQKLETDVNASAEIQIALCKFGLNIVADRLFVANKEYDVLFREYIAEKSAEEHFDIAELRKKCTKALGQFFDAVEYCAFAYEDVDYKPLINELEQLSIYYNRQLKIRATRHKNNKTTGNEPLIEPLKE